MSNTNFNTVPSDEVIQKTAASLEANNIHAIVVSTKEEAKEKALELIPQGAEVMDMLSLTLDTIGIADEINKSGKYNSVKNKLSSMDRATESIAMQKMGAAPEYAIGSVHAVTQDGHVMIASGSGSQIPGYAYGSAHVIWVVGAQKIVKNIDEGMRRIYEHSLPLENERALKAYGSKSAVRKILIVNEEGRPNRTTMILIKESIGF